ncbi:MAG: GNAT family N-acetyltransferase [Pseudomonadota bacterium]
MMAPHMAAPDHMPLPALQAALPRLKTDRLTLRVPGLDDLSLLNQISDEQRNQDLLAPDIWDEFLQMTATWVFRGHGWFTVADATGACGLVGLGFEPGDREPELGYLFAAKAHGKGYATEAARAVRDFGRDEAKLPSLVSYIHDGNTASMNVARKLGATRDATSEARLGEEGMQVWRHWGQVS